MLRIGGSGFGRMDKVGCAVARDLDGSIGGVVVPRGVAIRRGVPVSRSCPRQFS
jgi:hypothetical protein